MYPVFAAQTTQTPGDDRYTHVFGTADFMMNRDGVKEEIPVNGHYRITPRLPDLGVLTHFQVPERAQAHSKWSVTASVMASEGPAAGVAIWSGSKGYVLSFYPDGRGYMRMYQGRSISWNQDIDVRGFILPADITLDRDANGSVLGKVNGVIVAARLLDVNLKSPVKDKITTVSFATHSTKEKPGVSATYGTLHVEGWSAGSTGVF
ncbi:MAG: hypothetical protein LBQ58_08445 [Synergistaceae bacterium]|jgi:hypothetical protein|nr:hypothetical protein [Synergistaceae bacterium]